MYQLHQRIILISINELNTLNPQQVNWIINCSNSLNNYMKHPNYLNLNLPFYNGDSIQVLTKAYEFIIGQINLSQNIIILCENGISGGMLFSIFFLMKFHNMTYDKVYDQISKTIPINSMFYYYSLKSLENQIIQPLAQPATQYIAQPATQYTAQPATQYTAQYTAQPATQPITNFFNSTSMMVTK
jgi:hypothetical protein